MHLNSRVFHATAVNTRRVLTVGVNAHLTFGRENLIGKNIRAFKDSFFTLFIYSTLHVKK